MDQAPFKSRGALVLFNLSGIAVNAPKQFIGGRVAVIPVNLTESTPSALEESLEVQPSTEPGRLIDVLVVGRAARKRQRKGSKRR
jgi:hypothetical protein